jgi:hypothetical protein
LAQEVELLQMGVGVHGSDPIVGLIGESHFLTELFLHSFDLIRLPETGDEA